MTATFTLKTTIATQRRHKSREQRRKLSMQLIRAKKLQLARQADTTIPLRTPPHKDTTTPSREQKLPTMMYVAAPAAQPVTSRPKLSLHTPRH